MSAPALADAHFHLEAATNPLEVARTAGAASLAMLAVSVVPESFERLAASPVAECANVRLGLGFHPWWVEGSPADGERLERFERLLPRARFVGEVGVDLGRRHASTADAQLAAFRRIARACAREGGKTLSLHAVRSATEVMDVLEETGCARRCRCILHWFSGTSDEFARARALGMLFSVGEPMLATRKGREYARQAPLESLLVETDLPAAWDRPFDVADQVGSLGRALDVLAQARGRRADDAVLDNARRTLLL